MLEISAFRTYLTLSGPDTEKLLLNTVSLYVTHLEVIFSSDDVSTCTYIATLYAKITLSFITRYYVLSRKMHI